MNCFALFDVSSRACRWEQASVGVSAQEGALIGKPAFVCRVAVDSRRLGH
jgi:hypothetical protein